MTDGDTVRPGAEGPGAKHDPVPAAIDWLLGIVTGAIGLALTLAGAGTYAWIDRALIADAVATDGVRVEGLSPEEFVTAAGPFVDWFAVGVAVTGLGLVAGAVAFVRARRRTRRRVARDGGTTATFRACAVYGAAVTVLVSFVPGSTVVGGAVAAYLHAGDSGIRIGAVAGLIGFALSVPLLVFLSVGLLAGAGKIGALAAGAVLVGVVVVAELVALALTAGLGALGGFLVSRFV
ncbi:MAG: DUF5518 domain-containing protein [Salinirussus sp.]